MLRTSPEVIGSILNKNFEELHNLKPKQCKSMNLLTCSKHPVFATSKIAKTQPRLTSQIFKAMKLIVIFLTAFLLQTSAGGFAQKVTLKLNDASLDKVFMEIEKQTGYGFLYTQKMLNDAGKISLNVKNEPLTNVLNLCFSNRQLSYEIQDNTIIISQKSVVTVPSKAPTGIIITGKITDEDGNPLAGVSVFEKGTKNGTKSDANGIYSINNVSEKGMLQFTFVGYKTIETTVNNRNVIIT